jgi:UDP-N-acetylglucosamine--N-acetylmuramyl-(pentapeptide) pyrophosphoryl-undecaprenol N-acetylglucosamine transferase
VTPLQIVLATGGTGGHIYPALAVAAAARAAGHDVAVLGRRDGMEAEAVPAAGVTFHGVRAGKWSRGRPDPTQALRALAGVFEAIDRLRRERPDAVVGFGGYASFPGCVAATVLGIPLLLYEGNAFPGRVTRWFAARAAAVLATQRALERYLPQARSLAWVGFPVRRTTHDRRSAREALGLPDSALVTLVMGGSQGSLALNEGVPAAFERLERSEEHIVLHSSGRRWIEELRERTAGLPGYRTEAFLDATLAWPASDLAITRAGFSTLAEAATYGVPLIAVPLPTSAEDHQRHNAAALESAGAGRMLEESDLASLPEVWRSMLDPERRSTAAAAARDTSDPEAAESIVHHIESAARRQRRTTRSSV